MKNSLQRGGTEGIYSSGLLTARLGSSEAHGNWIQPHLENLLLIKKTVVFLKNRNAIFKKLVKIHNYILPVNEKHTDFEHLWTWSCIRKPGVCLVSQASGIIEHDQNQEASHCQDYWNLRLGQLVLWHFPRTWAKLAQSLPYREKILSTFKTGLQFLICKAYFQNHAPETLPDGLGQLNCTEDLIEKKRLNSCACPHVLEPTNFLVQSELWCPVRPFCSPLEFIISWDLRCSGPKMEQRYLHVWEEGFLNIVHFLVLLMVSIFVACSSDR